MPALRQQNRMNIYDISKEANVSTATVSRVLNGNAKVSEKTRTAVLEVIRRHGFQPNAIARGLSLKSMNMVCRNSGSRLQGAVLSPGDPLFGGFSAG